MNLPQVSVLIFVYGNGQIFLRTCPFFMQVTLVILGAFGNVPQSLYDESFYVVRMLLLLCMKGGIILFCLTYRSIFHLKITLP